MKDINENKIQILDIEKVFRSKNPKTARVILKIIINYIKKVIHQDELNYIIKKYNNCKSLDFLNGSISEFNVKTEMLGKENIPMKGRFIFVANHPIGSLDGMIFMLEMTKIYGETKSIVNDLLMNCLSKKAKLLSSNSENRFHIKPLMIQ